MSNSCNTQNFTYSTNGCDTCNVGNNFTRVNTDCDTCNVGNTFTKINIDCNTNQSYHNNFTNNLSDDLPNPLPPNFFDTIGTGLVTDFLITPTDVFFKPALLINNVGLTEIFNTPITVNHSISELGSIFNQGDYLFNKKRRFNIPPLLQRYTDGSTIYVGPINRNSAGFENLGAPKGLNRVVLGEQKAYVVPPPPNVTSNVVRASQPPPQIKSNSGMVNAVKKCITSAGKIKKTKSTVKVPVCTDNTIVTNTTVNLSGGPYQATLGDIIYNPMYYRTLNSCSYLNNGNGLVGVVLLDLCGNVANPIAAYASSIGANLTMNPFAGPSLAAGAPPLLTAGLSYTLVPAHNDFIYPKLSVISSYSVATGEIRVLYTLYYGPCDSETRTVILKICKIAPLYHNFLLSLNFLTDAEKVNLLLSESLVSTVNPNAPNDADMINAFKVWMYTYVFFLGATRWLRVGNNFNGSAPCPWIRVVDFPLDLYDNQPANYDYIDMTYVFEYRTLLFADVALESVFQAVDNQFQRLCSMACGGGWMILMYWECHTPCNRLIEDTYRHMQILNSVNCEITWRLRMGLQSLLNTTQYFNNQVNSIQSTLDQGITVTTVNTETRCE